MKLYRNILIFSVIIASLIVAVIFVNKIPDDKQNEEIVSTGEQTTENNYIDVLRVEMNDITNINVKTENEEYSISKIGDDIILSNSQGLKIARDKLNMLFNSCSYVFAESIASSKKEDASVYGFDAPRATVTVTLKNGNERKICIGKESVDKKGSYIKVDNDDNIYLRSAYGVSSLMPEYNSFIDTNILTVDPANYETLTGVYLKKGQNTEIKINSIGDGNEKAWIMFAPAYADANTITLSEKVLTQLAALKVTGVIDASPDDISRYGFDSPYAVIKISSDSHNQKLTFGDEVNGYRFLKVDDYSSIYAVSASAVSFLDVSYIDLMSRLVHLENIKSINKAEITYPDGKLTLVVDGEKRSINGKELSKDDFADVYQRVIGISLDSVDLNAVKSGTIETEIKYTRNDGSVCIVSFVSVDDRNYLALVDNKGNSIVKKKDVTDVIDYTLKMLENAK